MKFLLACAVTVVALVPAVGAQSPDDPAARIADALGHRPLTEDVTGIDWYTSNAEFMRLQQIDVPANPGEIFPEGWVVAVDSVDGTESRREEYRVLFRDGAAVGGEHIRYTAAGAVTHRRRVDASGEETLLERMTYRGDGTVRSVRRCQAEECLTARFAPPGEGGEESIIGDTLTLQIRYTGGGRPEYIRVDRDGEVTEEFLSYQEGRLAQRRVVREETVVTTTYSDDRVLTEEERVQRRLVRRTENTYDGQNRLVRQVEIRRNLRRETQWNYDVDDDYVMERFENEGLVLREETLGDITIRTHFRDGDPVFRETEVAGEVTVREIFVNGSFREEGRS